MADTAPQIIDGSFVDEALAGSQSDLLMKVRLKAGGDAFVYVLAEHKSEPSPALPLQLAGYTVRIWRRLAGDSHRKLRALPPIVPLVTYTGSKAWTVPAGLAEMIARALPRDSVLWRQILEYVVRTYDDVGSTI